MSGKKPQAWQPQRMEPRQFDMGRVIAHPNTSAIRDSLVRWGYEVRALGLDTLQGCTIPA